MIDHEEDEMEMIQLGGDGRNHDDEGDIEQPLPRRVVGVGDGYGGGSGGGGLSGSGVRSVRAGGATPSSARISSQRLVTGAGPGGGGLSIAATTSTVGGVREAVREVHVEREADDDDAAAYQDDELNFTAMRTEERGPPGGDGRPGGFTGARKACGGNYYLGNTTALLHACQDFGHHLLTFTLQPGPQGRCPNGPKW